MVTIEKFLLVSNVARSVVNFRFDLLKYIREIGHEVAVVCSRVEGDEVYINALREENIPVFIVPFSRSGINPIADLSAYFKSKKVLNEFKPTCVLAYTVKPIAYFIPAAASFGVHHSYSMLAGLGYAFSDEKNDWKSKLVSFVVKVLYRNALNKSSGVVFQNNDDPLLLKKEKVFDDENRTYVVAGSGVNLEWYQKAPLPNEVSFLIAARLLEEKGIRQYLEAAQILKSRYPHCRFLVAGGIDDNPSSVSQEEIDAWVLSGAVEYLGRVSDIRQALNEASVFVLPSFYREGTPRSILEALAMGRAIITSDMPGCRETVIEGWNGYLVPPRNVEALVEAMESLILNKNKVEIFGENSFQFACEKYDVNKVNSMMCKIMGLE